MSKRRNSNDESHNEQEQQKKRKYRILDDLKSNLTPKMLSPTEVTNGPKSRYGRQIKYKPNFLIKQNTLFDVSTQSSPINKRKVYKIFSIHNNKINPCLRLVSNRLTTFERSPIDKLIKKTKNRMKNQFQASLQTDDVQSNHPDEIIDLCCNENDTNIENELQHETTDPIENITTFVLAKKHCLSIDDEQIILNRRLICDDYGDDVIDNIDLTGSDNEIEAMDTNVDENLSTDADEDKDIDERNNYKNENEIENEIEMKIENMDDNQLAMELPESTIDSGVNFTAINTLDSLLSDDNCNPSSDKNNYDNNNSIVDNNNKWNNGDLVWAAMTSYPFWPAIVSKPLDEQSSHLKGNFVAFFFEYFLI